MTSLSWWIEAAPSHPSARRSRLSTPIRFTSSGRKLPGRTTSDPEGAITAARTLLETVCKYILDDCNVTYPDDADLPKLWALAAAELNLAPQQHDEKVFKAILGNVQSVVNYVGTIRNRLGDAHGRGRKPTKPKPRYAEPRRQSGWGDGDLSHRHVERSGLSDAS